MTEASSSARASLDEFTAMFARQEAAEARLVQARDDHPLAYSLAMAALAWEQVDRRGWRGPQVLCAQARRLMVTRRIPPLRWTTPMR